MQSAHRDRIAHAEPIKLVHQILQRAVIDLIHGQDHRFLAAVQHLGDIAVIRGHSIPAVDQEDDAIRFIHRDLHLHVDLIGEGLILDLDAAGVDQLKLSGQPLDLAVNAVPGHAGGIFYDALSLSDQAVEHSGFSDVGPAYDRYGPFIHRTSPPHTIVFSTRLRIAAHTSSMLMSEVSISCASAALVSGDAARCIS